MNNKDGELTEEEYREVIKYGGGMLINIIIGVVAAVAIAVYMGMLKKGRKTVIKSRSSYLVM